MLNKRWPANGVCLRIYDYQLSVSQAQTAAIDEAIRTVPFMRNQWVRTWMDGRGLGDNDLHVSGSHLAKDFPCAACLHSEARQTAADRAWLAMARCSKNCREKQPGKQGYPRLQHDNRSVEYTTTGWKREPDGMRLTGPDGNGIGTLRMLGANPQRTKARPMATCPIGQIKRVRLVKRAAGSDVQFAVKADRPRDHQATGQQVGMDVGLKSFSTDADGTTVETPRDRRQAEKRLKRLHRRVSKKQQGSKHRKQASKRLANGYLKVSRQRKDCAGKPASALVKSRDFLADVDLKIANLVKHHHQARE